MRSSNLLFFLTFLCCGSGLPLPAQNACDPGGVVDTSSFSGSAFFNYGSHARLTSVKYRSALAVGQTFVGRIENSQNSSTLGFYARYQLPPFAVSVTATQGDLLDRIQLSWEIDALGPSPNDGFNIYRDGVFLATVGSNIRNYNDFNVIAGVPYNYTVRGINLSGEGAAGHALGFQVPNGVVTGLVQTANGNPVPDAVVTLTPMQGFSAKFGPLDGAFTLADSSGNAFMPASGGDWTMTFWIRTDAATANAGLIQLSPFPLFFRALNSTGGHEGVEVATSAAGAPFLSGTFPDSTKNGWHHVALGFDGSDGQGRLYIDGRLVALADMSIVGATDIINFGSRTGSGGWTGRLDELRIYHRRLDELDFREVMEGTATSLTPDLTHYWKMDEEQGLRSYDIMKRLKLHFCGAAFDADRPPVRTAGKTTADGFYRIESASYGTGTTFVAEPRKAFYLHRALKMNRDEMDYATLPDFAVPPQATLELWVNSAGPDGEQCLLSKKWAGNDFRLLLRPNGLINEVWFSLNGQEHKFGPLGMGYQHLAFTIDSSGANRTVAAYKNGLPFGAAHAFAGVSGNWSDPAESWVLGARPTGAAYTDHYGGLMDEVAVYDTTLSAAVILSHFQQSRDLQEKGLRVYFALDEGSGNTLNHSGAAFLLPGASVGAEWSPFAANQMTQPHVFTPATRQVTLNPSVTSVDQVDFTDRSTIPVSGYVRYKDTDCFAANVEILVNGASYYPPVFTDSTGKFVIELEPGATAFLAPKLEDHVFAPAARQVVNVSAPIAGILFNDMTTRKIDGQIAGGHCKLSIISPTGSAFPTDCRITVSTKDKCFERTILVDDVDGLYEFANLPPLEVTVAITKHNNPDIYDDFQTQGGRTIDLLTEDSTGVDFIYIAPPQVQVEGFADFTKACPPDSVVVIGQMDVVDLYIKCYEQYGGGQDPADRCYLDSAALSINNTFDYDYNFLEPLDTFYTGGEFHYRFAADHPNEYPPHRQIMEIVADDMGRKSEQYLQEAIITGTVVGEAKFTTQLPMLPSFVLRDPPGDGSSAYLESNTRHCNFLKFGEEASVALAVSTSATGGAHTEITIPFVGTHVEFIASYENTSEFTTTITQTHQNSMEYCVSNKERISTDDGDIIVGGSTILNTTTNDTLAGADVYVGVGFNVIFSDSKEVTFNDTFCVVNVDNIVTVSPDTFVTNYKYSEWNIENNVVKYLDTLIAQGFDQDSINTRSRRSWLSFMELNRKAKEAALYDQNISFDAGIQYESAETIDNSTVYEESVRIAFLEEIESQLLVGLLQPGVALFDNEITATIGLSGLIGTGESNTNGLTTGYVLKDDDPGDTWSMDVKKDPIFKTPVFDIKAGQTSCPWEVGTAHRQGVVMVPQDGVIRTNVPSNEAASFHFVLGNNSSTFETWSCVINTGPESNPDGAVIRLNGGVLDQPVLYAIPWGTTIPVTITVERGPDAYDYGVTTGVGVEVVSYSLCHDERCTALGIAPDNETFLYSANYLRVQFLKPCSEVNITGPFDGWVVKPDALNPAQQDILPITVSGYDLGNPDFQAIRLQYRLENGDGAWINITPPTDIPKADLGPVFTTYHWNTGGSPALADGPYEIRAVTVCTGGGDENGYSDVVTGKIERQPPSLVGTPEPSDGVLQVGDEISFTFNKPVNCSELIQADIMNPNNVGLYDATTGELIDASVTCTGNKIVIDPLFQNEFFENHILRAELHNIQDLTGNVLVETEWEFYVDRNELAWLTDSAGTTKYVDETKTFTANIHNRGGYPVPFTILEVPDWVHVTPDAGTLAPNEVRAIEFTVDSSVAMGQWADSVVLHTETGLNPFFMGGDEYLPIGTRVICRPPNWTVNPAQYQLTMNLVLQLQVGGLLSADAEDQVGVFIQGQLRGTAKLTYVASVNKWLAFVTVYGDATDANLPLVFEIFDASECQRYPGTLAGNHKFVANAAVGSAGTPGVVISSSLVLRDIPLADGWNWISFNLGFPDPAINAVLANLPSPVGDLIKDQTKFSTFNNPGWAGSLATLNNKSLYLYQANADNMIKHVGTPLDPATVPIPVVAGWNWIGYVPNYPLPVNTALASVPAQPGDLIKSQVAFAQYINAGTGWVGNLTQMRPPNGYLLKMTQAGTLTYPPQSLAPDPAESRGGRPDELPVSFWTVDPSQFEHSMTLIGMFVADSANATTATMELGAFAGDECRGAATAIYIEPLDAYLFFLTSYANLNGEALHFKLFDTATGAVQDLSGTMSFSPNHHQGTIDDPVPFGLQGLTGTADPLAGPTFDIQPNPFRNGTMLRFGLPHGQDVGISITDAGGREVWTREASGLPGRNELWWNGVADTGWTLPSGVYFVRLKTDEGMMVRKVVLER